MKNIKKFIEKVGKIKGFTTTDISGYPQFTEDEIGASFITKYYGGKPMIIVKNGDTKIEKQVETIGKDCGFSKFVWTKIGSDEFLNFNQM